MQPPKDIPIELVSAFTMNGKVKVKRQYLDEASSVNRRGYNSKVVRECIKSIKHGSLGPYPKTTKALNQALKDYSIKGKTVLVMGSQKPYYESLCVLNGAWTVTVEYGRLLISNDKMSAITVEEYKKVATKYDAAVSISSFEHSGLGRYGDPIDPDGDLKAMRTLRSKLDKGALLYLAVPKRKDVLYWNAHREYGKHRWPLLIEGWTVLKTYKADDQPVVVLKNG